MDTRREYPENPIPGISAVVFSGDEVLLVRRGNEPSRGRWGLPGGVVELGEGAEDAVVREVEEETGILIQPTGLLAVFDSIVRNDEDRVQYHYVLCEYLCEAVEGEFHASSDVSDARWVPIKELVSIEMNPGTRRFIEKIAKQERIIV